MKYTFENLTLCSRNVAFPAIKVLFITASLLWPILSTATESTHQRKTFINAEDQLKKSNNQSFKQLYNQLYFYPLQPYLEQQILRQEMSLANASKIEAFLKKYKGSPLDWPLRKSWLRFLAKYKRQTLYLNAYKPTSNAELSCHFHRFQLSAGVPASVVLPAVTKLWTVGKSQHKSCDPLFEQWQKAGYRTDAIVWQRLRLAADGGKHTLIPYLTKLLPKEQQYLGELWRKVRSDPSYIHQLIRFSEHSIKVESDEIKDSDKLDKEKQILVYGLKRLIWRDVELALSVYKKSQKNFEFSSKQQNELYAKFALALSSKNHKDAIKWLDKVPKELLTKDLIQWRLTSLLQLQDWEKITYELTSLPHHYKDALQWKFWYGRAMIETGKKESGETVLQQVSTQRHYYGFLAASYLKVAVNLQDEPLVITADERAAVLKPLAAKRAFELFYLKRYIEARREWNYWLSSLSDRQKLVASKIANEEKWFDRAIFTLSKVGYLNDVNLRFPSAFESTINSQADKNKINASWAFAIARRESSFMPDANSPVGAKGLMQIMPGTAKQLAKKTVSTHYLLNANNNITLGTKYLRELLQQNKGNHVLATASYNAGPYRVKKWVKKVDDLPADIWIEMIPYKETREYVKSVLAYQQIYQIKSGQTQSFFDQVVKMKIN